MRLIDADKLKRTEGMFQYQINDAFDRLSASAYRFEDVENAPTVEAIPVEWLEQHIKELDTELQSLYSRFCSQEDSKEKNEALLRCVEISPMLRAYETVLSEWRKENGCI